MWSNKTLACDNVIYLSIFTILIIILYYFIFHILKIYLFYIMNIHLLVSRFELWSPRRQFIVFVNQLSVDIITCINKIWIYYNYIKNIYKSNFEFLFLFSYFFQTKEMKFYSWFFFKNLHMRSKINISNFKSFVGKDI